MSSVTITRESMVDLFDNCVLDWLRCRLKYGDDSIVTMDYKSQAFGILRALQRTHIIDQEIVFKVIDCLYDGKQEVSR